MAVTIKSESYRSTFWCEAGFYREHIPNIRIIGIPLDHEDTTSNGGNVNAAQAAI